MPISDDEVKNILFGQQTTTAQPQLANGQQGISDDQVKNILFGSTETQQTSDESISTMLSEAAVKPSAIGIIDRLKLSFADDRGREAELRKKFQFVERLESGKFAVGNSPKEMTPIDPEGVFNDVIGDLADVVSEIPVIAGQIVGTGAGAAGGNVPGAIAGSAVGAGVGEAAKQGIGKALGVNDETAKEMATDIAISTAFGAAGEGISQAAKVVGQKVIAPQLVKMLAKNADDAAANGTDGKFATGVSRVFRYLAGVPEESTLTFAKYGWNEMDSAVHFDKKTVLGLVDDAVQTLDTANEKLGQLVSKNKGELIAAARRIGPTSNIAVEDLFKTLKSEAQRLDILDELGAINKKYPNSEEVKPIINLMRELGEIKDGKFVATANKNIDVEKAIKLSESFGQKFDKVTPRVQKVFFDVLNGNEQAGVVGLRQRVTSFASKIGMDDYAKANENYSRFLKLRENLSALDTKNPGNIEKFINRLDSLGSVPQRDLMELEKYAPKPFLKNWQLWNAAQDFTKANPNLLRFGAIAAALGTMTGFDTRNSQIGTFVGAAMLGTPAGLRVGVRAANAVGKIGGRETLKKVVEGAKKPADNRAATAVLSRLLEQKSTEKKQR